MFMQSAFRTAARSFKPLGFGSSARGFMSSPMKQRFFSSARTQVHSTTSSASSIGLFIGASSALLLHTSSSKILNDVANLGTINAGRLESNVKSLDPRQQSVVTSRFGGKLQYRQLCYGSLIGVFAGVVIGKLSSVLVFITLSTVLLLQFLQTRGIIHVPWTAVVKVGADRVDIRQLFLEDPSFKLSFALTFLIAAFNI